ncbi:MAG TPA: hypothetical protein VGZ29_03705 [Terriglobia bacterium]|nr:hypothetical protein [Terriglobia bacterium]
MSRWIFDTVWIVAGILGVVLTAMYVRAAQKLYARDREHPASGQDAKSAGEPHAGEESSKLVS